MKRFALILACLAGDPLAAQEPAPAHQSAVLQVCLRVPGAEEVHVARDIAFKDAGSPSALHLDLYSPPDCGQDAGLPVVVFMNGVGLRNLKESGAYESWARATAAVGLAAVTFQSSPGQIEADVEDLMAYLRANAGGLGIDADNMCWWACSDSVARTLPLALQEDRTYVRCAVVYYGMAEDRQLGNRRPDLPVFLVKAGLDVRHTNARIDNFVQKSSAANRDMTYVVYAGGRHAFDVFDDTARTCAIIQDTLDFMKLHLSPVVQLEVEGLALIREASAAMRLHDWNAMATACERLIRMQPDNGEAHFQLGYAQLALGSLDESIESFGRAIECQCSVDRSAYNIGCAYARKGDKDRAFAWLDKAIESGFSDHVFLKGDPDLADLRGDERFSQVLQKCAGKRRE